MARAKVSLFLIILLSSLVFVLSACGGGGGGGGGGGDVVDIPDTDIQTVSGLVDGGVAKSATQTMRGIVPNPSGASGSTFGGKAYLVLNGQKIQLNVVNGSGGGTLGRSERTFTKGGKTYSLTPRSAFSTPMVKEGAEYTWVYEVTFSVNAGPNTISIEVYNMNNTLFARSEQWDVIGAIEPAGMTVTLSWDTNYTDIDLWVANVDDSGNVLGQACGWTRKTATDGDSDILRLDYDDTNGYGPEHITLDNASRTKKYAVKVYYYADHDENTEEIQPTTACVTAEANGEMKLSDSNVMTVAGGGSSWASGAHIWDVGTFEVTAPNRFNVDVQTIDTSSFPTVALTVHVTDPNNPTEPNVEDLAQSNFYVINAGMAMSPVTVSGGTDGVYTLTYTDITCGKRDLYVYVYVPAQGEELMKAGLSDTKTYGKNYALLVGLNEYPPAAPTRTGVGWVNANTLWADVQPTPPGSAGGVLSANEFTMKFYQSGVYKETVTGSTITDQGGGTYRVTFPKPASAEILYDGNTMVNVFYLKEAWLDQCLNDVTDMKNALLSQATGFSNSAWESANIHQLTNSNATESAIESKIMSISADMNPCDLFLFLFSGHGSGMPADGEDAQYLCAYEDENWISVNDLENMLWFISADTAALRPAGLTNIFIIIDACHSGNFIGKERSRKGSGDVAASLATLKYRPFLAQAEPYTGGKGTSFAKGLHSEDDFKNTTFVMTAVPGTVSAWDDPTLQNGVLVYYLVDGINVSGIAISGAKANANKDIWVTGEEAFSYLDPLVAAWVSPPRYNDTPDDPSVPQDPQLYDNSTTTLSRLIYCW